MELLNRLSKQLQPPSHSDSCLAIVCECLEKAQGVAASCADPWSVAHDHRPVKPRRNFILDSRYSLSDFTCPHPTSWARLVRRFFESAVTYSLSLRSL
jgi:hypothetical protein